MRFFVLTLLAVFPVFAEKMSGSCSSEFRTAFPEGGSLRLQIRPGDTEVVGSDRPQLRITCDGEADVHFTLNGRSGEVRVWGGPRNHFRVLIEVPRHTHLWVRSPAGDLTVSGVVGDKDMELYAGDLKIDVGDPSLYDQIDGSVYAGDLHATAFRVVKGGLFRSFSQENRSGRYRLHAHVGAGDVVLR